MKRTINCNGRIISLDSPKIMGIMNITPDSYYKDSRIYSGDEGFLKKAEKMLEEGADILDLGGYSTRPGASEVSESEEWARLEIPLQTIRKNFPMAILSIDTFRAEIAERAIQEGADMINDISGGDLDLAMHKVIEKYNIPYILMHMRGDPGTMQSLVAYEDIFAEVSTHILQKANGLKNKGIHDIIIDPGFGFAKTLDQNYQLVNQIDQFSHWGFPLLMGISRKSMLYKLLDVSPEDVLPETSALHLWGMMSKVGILRVHDVKRADNIRQIYLKTRSIG
ncbi:MAG: dihydropteroate synthase [Leadbetterella sp.]